MRRRTFLASLLAVALQAGIAPAFGDTAPEATDMQTLRSAVQADKRGYVAGMLKLSAAEAKKFWPIYDQYQRARAGADARRAKAIVDVVGREGPLTDAYARTLAGELMAADEAEIKARRILQNRLMRAVSPRTAARYLQLEAKIRALEAYDIASSLPLVQ
jgi:outer membrane PBP1 activator LpoA protein